jgi:hypothetical protein
VSDYEVVRTDEEIDDVLNIAVEQADKGGSAYPGMTFEQGVSEGIRWLVGHNDDAPLGE